MNIAKMIYIGWYKILANTLYDDLSYERNSNGVFGPRLHALLITFTCHSLNLWSGLRYTLTRLYCVDAPVWVGIVLVIGICFAGYWNYFQGRQPKKDSHLTVGLKGIVFAILCAILYGFLSGYLLISVGNYVRENTDR